MHAPQLARIALPLLALPLLALAAPPPASGSLPTCSAQNGHRNLTLRGTTINELETVSTAGQEAGEASIYILGYPGFGKLVPGIVHPVTNNTLFDWIPSIQQAAIKCPICKNATDGEVMYRHVRKYPIISYEDLENLFQITANTVNTINDKQCDIDNYTPPESVKRALRPFIDALWAAMGVGPIVGPQAGLSGIPSGAILPYYNCLAKWANATSVSDWQSSWFALNQALYNINQTNCVNH